jgi:hypothetical protein
MTHDAFYAGWPTALSATSAVLLTKEVVTQDA